MHAFLCKISQFFSVYPDPLDGRGRPPPASTPAQGEGVSTPGQTQIICSFPQRVEHKSAPMQCMHSRSTCSRHRPAVDLLLNVAGLSIAAWWSISFVQNSILRWRRTNPTYLFDNLQTAVRLPIAVIRVGLQPDWRQMS